MKTVNRILCRIFGHKEIFVFEWRFRRNKPFWKGESKGRCVHGAYTKCASKAMEREGFRELITAKHTFLSRCLPTAMPRTTSKTQPNCAIN